MDMDTAWVWVLCCRLSDNEAKSEPAYKQEAVSKLPAGGGAAVPMSEQVRKWLRLLRLEEAALHQDIKRHALAQAYSKAQSIQKRRHASFWCLLKFYSYCSNISNFKILG